MKKREDIVEKFSTFLSFRDNNSDQKPIWQEEPELNRYMRRLVQSEPEAKEEFWARHFLKIVRGVSQTKKPFSEAEELEELSLKTRSRPFSTTELTSRLRNNTLTSQDWETYYQSEASPKELAHQHGNFPILPDAHQDTNSSKLFSLKSVRHLSAYLQEACFWVAQKRYQKFKFLRHKYTLLEYFQIGNSLINQPEKLFKSFNFEQTQTNIEGYAKTAITRFIKNTIYQHDLEAKREKFSDYGLLKNLSSKEMKEALLWKGINNQKIELLFLAWKCFDDIYQPNKIQGNRSLEAPNIKDLQQITACYNHRLNKLSFSAIPASEEKIQEMLENCIQAARDYRTKSFLNLEDYGDISDPTPTLWDTAMQLEEQEQVQEIIARLFEAIPETGQTLLILWQGLNLTQTEIAIVLKGSYPEIQKQYQVARQLGRYTKHLLQEFTNEWNKLNPTFRLNNEEDIERIKESLIECLQSHCCKLLFSNLEIIVEKYSHEDRMLSLCSCSEMNGEKVDKQLTLSLSKPKTRSVNLKRYLTTHFHEHLEKSMRLTKDSLDFVSKKIAIFVDEWLRSYQI